MSDYWQRIAAETHAKLIDAREQIARFNSADFDRRSRLRDETLALLLCIDRTSQVDAEIRRMARALLGKMGCE